MNIFEILFGSKKSLKGLKKCEESGTNVFHNWRKCFAGGVYYTVIFGEKIEKTRGQNAGVAALFQNIEGRCEIVPWFWPIITTFITIFCGAFSCEIVTLRI